MAAIAPNVTQLAKGLAGRCVEAKGRKERDTRDGATFIGSLTKNVCVLVALERFAICIASRKYGGVAGDFHQALVNALGHRQRLSQARKNLAGNGESGDRGRRTACCIDTCWYSDRKGIPRASVVKPASTGWLIPAGLLQLSGVGQ